MGTIPGGENGRAIVRIIPDVKGATATVEGSAVSMREHVVRTDQAGAVNIEVLAPGSGVSPAGSWTHTIYIDSPRFDIVKHVALSQGETIDIMNVNPTAEISPLPFGGGGGGGSSSNLPINPNNPKTPVKLTIPGNPSIENTFPTVNNPLDNQKKSLGMKALKEKIEKEWNDRDDTVAIPSDTRKIEGSTQKIAILSTDFLNNHDYNDHFDNDSLITKYPGIEIVPRTDSKNSIADEGEKELEMLIGRGEGTHFPITYSNKTKLKPIVASIGTGGSDKNDISTELSLKVYGDVLNRFGSQKVKVFYQTSDTDTTIKISGYSNQTIRNLTFYGDEKTENAVILNRSKIKKFR